MFLNRLDFLVLFAGPEGLVCVPSGFTISPQPIEQRWIQGNCKAKGGDPFDCEGKQTCSGSRLQHHFLHSFRVSLMQSQLASHKRVLKIFSFLHRRSGGFPWYVFIALFLKTSNHIPYSQTRRCPTCFKCEIDSDLFLLFPTCNKNGSK